MKNSLYKKRLALLLAVILSFQGVIPVSASSLSGNAAVAAAAFEGASANGQGVDKHDTGAVTANTAVSRDSASDDTASSDTLSEGTVSKDTVSEGTVSKASVSGDTASENTVSSDETEGVTVSASTAGQWLRASSEEESVSADLTIMYYMVGSNLEGEGGQATKDMIEIMTGMENAYSAFSTLSHASVNVIVETGGVS
ncbi:MAG: hypothetical protein IJU93_10170, partial [Lachnospiraceae bacterium]|nr:hypothetical protein [Lachnospiraceae bacterium]